MFGHMSHIARLGGGRVSGRPCFPSRPVLSAPVAPIKQVIISGPQVAGPGTGGLHWQRCSPLPPHHTTPPCCTPPCCTPQHTTPHHITLHHTAPRHNSAHHITPQHTAPHHNSRPEESQVPPDTTSSPGPPQVPWTPRFPQTPHPLPWTPGVPGTPNTPPPPQALLRSSRPGAADTDEAAWQPATLG